MVVVAAVGLGACSSGKEAAAVREQAERDRAQAEKNKAEAEAAKRKAEEELRKLELEIEGFRKRLLEVQQQMEQIDGDLLAAKSQADRDAIAVRQADLRFEQAKIQADIDRARATLKRQ